MDKTELEKMVPVVCTYSFDEQVDVFLSENYKKATETLENLYNEELRIQIEENERILNKDLIASISKDKNYARLTTKFEDIDDTMEWKIGTIHVK